MGYLEEDHRGCTSLSNALSCTSVLYCFLYSVLHLTITVKNKWYSFFKTHTTCWAEQHRAQVQAVGKSERRKRPGASSQLRGPPVRRDSAASSLRGAIWPEFLEEGKTSNDANNHINNNINGNIIINRSKRLTSSNYIVKPTTNGGRGGAAPAAAASALAASLATPFRALAAGGRSLAGGRGAGPAAEGGKEAVAGRRLGWGALGPQRLERRVRSSRAGSPSVLAASAARGPRQQQEEEPRAPRFLYQSQKNGSFKPLEDSVITVLLYSQLRFMAANS
ncbi:uncharacterized protein PS065_020532 [Dugong dugon]